MTDRQDAAVRRPLSRRRFVVAGLGALLAACTGQVRNEDRAAVGGAPTPAPEPTPSSTPSVSPPPSPALSPSPTETFDVTTTPGGGADLPTGIVPTRITIPAIDVDAACVELDLRRDEVEVPDFGLAGWWVQTRRPGEIGPAVMGAHVDSRSGPDVFFRLRDLRRGDTVMVRDEDGATRTFVVDLDPIQVDKDDRPPEVFGFGERRPELRLITCGGDFNPAIGSYDSNIVVFAHDPSFTG